jgi:hypothetical protein
LLSVLFTMLGECRTLLPKLERPRHPNETVSAKAERILYFTLVSALEAALVRAMEDALHVLRQASHTLGPIRTEWLSRQARTLKREGE